MSAGAVFKLIANDGKADRLIMATKLLNQRINDVMCARKKAGKADITPTLVDLERTHILFINAHFKPFAAIGYEYNKVKPQSGNPVLGAEVTFSIPQFGDFFADMVCRVAVSAVTAVSQPTPSTSGTTGPLPVNTSGGSSGPITTYSLVDPLGNAVTAGGGANTYANWVRWCEFPGNQLFQTVKFEVNGNPLDQYNNVCSAFLEKFTVTPNKRDGYNRLVGQEQERYGAGTPKLATVNVSGVNQYNASAAQITAGALFPTPDDNNTPAALLSAYLTGGPTVYNDYTREKLTYLDGPQTPKPTQPAFEIWNKLHFWFNDDFRLSIPSVSIPFGQRFITISLNTQANLVFEYPGIFLRKAVISTGPPVSEVINYAPLYNSVGVGAVSITNIELYVNNIFVNPEVHDIFIKRIGFTLIRVYRFQSTNVNVANNSILMSQLKWPVEYIFLGLQPTWNISSSNQFQWRDWHRMNKNMTAQVATPSLASIATAVGAGTTDTTSSTSSVGQIDPNWYALPLQTVDSITVTAHGINIFDNFNQIFFNSYMPYAYGGASLETPQDTGALFINFSLFPRSYNPSGHINVSRAREFYIQYFSSYVTSNTPAKQTWPCRIKKCGKCESTIRSFCTFMQYLQTVPESRKAFTTVNIWRQTLTPQGEPDKTATLLQGYGKNVKDSSNRCLKSITGRQARLARV